MSITNVAYFLLRTFYFPLGKKKIALKKKESRNLSHQNNDKFAQFTLSSYTILCFSEGCLLHSNLPLCPSCGNHCLRIDPGWRLGGCQRALCAKELVGTQDHHRPTSLEKGCRADVLLTLRKFALLSVSLKHKFSLSRSHGEVW